MVRLRLQYKYLLSGKLEPAVQILRKHRYSGGAIKESKSINEDNIQPVHNVHLLGEGRTWQERSHWQITHLSKG